MSRLPSVASATLGAGRRTLSSSYLLAFVEWLRGRFALASLQRRFSLVDAALDSAIDARPARLYIGLMGVIGFPAYYLIWTYAQPQPYESLALRLALAALFVPYLLPRSVLDQVRHWWPWYWHGSLLLALPFFFTYMALENNTTSWALSFGTAVMFTLVLVPAAVAVFMLTSGVFLAGWLHLLRHPHADLSEQLIVQGWPVLLFAVGGGLILNIAVEKHKRRRTEVLLSVAGFVAHELRTPLSSIELQLAGCRQDPGTVQSRLPTLAREAQRAQVFIDMLLTSLRPAHIEVEALGPVNMSHIVRSAVQRYPYANERQRRAVEVRIAREFTVKGVEILLEHLILNLMKNAFTHGRRDAGFQVTISSESDDVEDRLIISDNGCGIPAADLPRVVHRYYQAGSAGAAVGTGLGLSFCQDVMRSLGGHLEVASSQNEGTDIRLHFPRT
jgi:two-component system CAI-1 autoinducer sensor kinase/phosphatase CqsS